MGILHGIKITAIACTVPKHKVDNLQWPGYDQEKLEKIVKGTGVRFRNLAEPQVECASDFCYSAAKRIIDKLNIDVRDVGVLILVTQSPDYIIPATSCILQHRLGLPNDTIAFDVNLGCSGYVYGLHIAGSMLQNSGKRYALLLAGDTSLHVSEDDQSAIFLFGDAGSATLLEYCSDASPLVFSFGTDGSGAMSLYIKAGAGRYPITPDSLIPKLRNDGNIRADGQLVMDGMEIFNFAISTVVGHIKEFIDPIDSYDGFVFHQANHFMLETMRKLIKIPKQKFLLSLYNFGNTSSPSIPITLCQDYADQELSGKFLLSGFGVGLSWGSVNAIFNKTTIFRIEEDLLSQ